MGPFQASGVPGPFPEGAACCWFGWRGAALHLAVHPHPVLCVVQRRPWTGQHPPSHPVENLPGGLCGWWCWHPQPTAGTARGTTSRRRRSCLWRLGSGRGRRWRQVCVVLLDQRGRFLGGELHLGTRCGKRISVQRWRLQEAVQPSQTQRGHPRRSPRDPKAPHQDQGCFPGEVHQHIRAAIQCTRLLQRKECHARGSQNSPARKNCHGRCRAASKSHEARRGKRVVFRQRDARLKFSAPACLSKRFSSGDCRPIRPHNASFPCVPAGGSGVLHPPFQAVTKRRGCQQRGKHQHHKTHHGPPPDGPHAVHSQCHAQVIACVLAPHAWAFAACRPPPRHACKVQPSRDGSATHVARLAGCPSLHPAAKGSGLFA